MGHAWFDITLFVYKYATHTHLDNHSVLTSHLELTFSQKRNEDKVDNQT